MSLKAKISFFLAVFLLAVVIGMALHQSTHRRVEPPSAAEEAHLITFNGEIAPILFRNCAACHRPGNDPAQSFLTYAEVKKNGNAVVRAVEAGTMPPWLPDPGHPSFAGEPAIGPQERVWLAAWLKEGMPEGNESPAPSEPLDEQPAFGQPDLVLTMPTPFQLDANGLERSVAFVLKPRADTSRHIRAVEFKVSAPEVVESAALRVDRDSKFGLTLGNHQSQAIDGLLPAAFPEGILPVWRSGENAVQSPPGASWLLAPADDLVLILRLRPNGKATAVSASVGLMFDRAEPVTLSETLVLGASANTVATNINSTASTGAYRLPADFVLWAIYADLPNNARAVSLSAQYPSGAVQPLLSIKKWNPRWNDAFQYSPPLLLPAGCLLSFRVEGDPIDATAAEPAEGRRLTPSQRPTAGKLHLAVTVKNQTDLELFRPETRPPGTN